MRTIDAICPFESRGQVHRIADYGVAPGIFRADVADYDFAGANANAQVNGWRVSAQPCDVRQFSTEIIERR